MFSKSSVLIASKDFTTYESLIEQLDAAKAKVIQTQAECLSIEIEAVKHEPDIIIIETDGIDFSELKRLIKNILLLKNSTYIFTLSSYERLNTMQGLMSLGVTKCMTIPYVLSDLYEAIQNCILMNPIDISHIHSEIYKSIHDMLALFNLHSGVQGYSYLRKALFMCILNKNAKLNFSKEVYPEIAKKFDTNPACVEWAIRSAISRAWKRTEINIKALFFSKEKLKNHNKPTNNEFIHTLGNYIRNEYYELIDKLPSDNKNTNCSSPPLHKV